MPLLDFLRQLLYPMEFRIAASPWGGPALAHLERLAMMAGDDADAGASAPTPRAASSTGGGGSGAPAAPGKNQLTIDKLVNPEPFTRFLGQIAVGLWRLRKKLTAENGEPLEAMKPAWRAFESVYGMLEKEEIEIQDHTGSPYRPGMKVAVIAFQPTAGIASEQIVETIRPSIYLHSEIIQPGEVIVATPLTEKTAGPASPPSA